MIFHEKILKEFQKNKVKYIIVGGVGYNLLGGARNTFDLDIIIELTETNLTKLLKIFKKLNYKIKIPFNPKKLLDRKTRLKLIKEKNLMAINFYERKTGEEIDIIIKTPVSYLNAEKSMEIIKMKSLKLPVISIDNLIKMKKASNRLIDQLDLRSLKEIKRLRRRYHV